MVIEIESESRSLEEITEELAEMVCRTSSGATGAERTIRELCKHRLRELLNEFANEIKRKAIEP